MTVTPAGRGPQLMAVTIFFLALITTTMGLRMYCRIHVVKSFGLDDWFAALAWCLYVVYSTFVISGIYHGTGQHAQDIQPPTELPVALKWWWACEVVFVLSNMALKLSIGTMLLRLTVIKVHRIIIYVMLAVTQIYCLAFFFIFIFQCQAPSYFWTQYTGGSGKCINPQITVVATYVYSAIICVGDWTFAIIPIFLVWNLQMNSRRKIAVAIILSMGAVASAATIIRLPYLGSLSNTADFLYATTDVAIWSSAETGLGIAACSLATLRPLFRTFFNRTHLLGGSTSNKMSSGGNRWPSAGGYKRSKGTGDSYALRSDVRTGQGVVTVIEADAERDLEAGALESNRKYASQKSLANGTGWRSSTDSKASLDGGRREREREIDWSAGIRKTTVQNQVVN